MKIQFDNEKKEWIELEKGTREGIYIDGLLKPKLDLIKKMQKQNFDVVFIIDGKEGSGKSTLSMLCAWYLSNTKLTINNFCEGSNDAVQKLDKIEDGGVLVIDEGSLVFSSKDAMMKEQKQIMKILNVIRQKKLVLIIVAPLYFELAKYIAVSRSSFLLHVYAKQFKRGFFSYYSEKRKSRLYVEGKKRFNSYAVPYPNFRGRFSDFKLPFEAEYQVLKKKSLKEALDPKSKELSPSVVREFKVNILKEMCSRNIDKEITTQTNIAKLLGLSLNTVNKYYKELVNNS